MDRRKFMGWTASSSIVAMLTRAGVADASKPVVVTDNASDADHLDAMQRYAVLTDAPKAVIGMLVSDLLLAVLDPRIRFGGR